MWFLPISKVNAVCYRSPRSPWASAGFGGLWGFVFLFHQPKASLADYWPPCACRRGCWQCGWLHAQRGSYRYHLIFPSWFSVVQYRTDIEIVTKSLCLHVCSNVCVVRKRSVLLQTWWEFASVRSVPGYNPGNALWYLNIYLLTCVGQADRSWQAKDLWADVNHSCCAQLKPSQLQPDFSPRTFLLMRFNSFETCRIWICGLKPHICMWHVSNVLAVNPDLSLFRIVAYIHNFFCEIWFGKCAFFLLVCCFRL